MKKNNIDLNIIKNDLSEIREQVHYLSDLPSSINNLLYSLDKLFNILQEIKKDINNQDGKIIILNSFERKINKLERTVDIQKKWASTINKALQKAADDFADI